MKIKYSLDKVKVLSDKDLSEMKGGALSIECAFNSCKESCKEGCSAGAKNKTELEKRTLFS